jgi:hypothetical protein
MMKVWSVEVCFGDLRCGIGEVRFRYGVVLRESRETCFPFRF